MGKMSPSGEVLGDMKKNWLLWCPAPYWPLPGSWCLWDTGTRHTRNGEIEDRASHGKAPGGDVTPWMGFWGTQRTCHPIDRIWGTGRHVTSWSGSWRTYHMTSPLETYHSMTGLLGVAWESHHPMDKDRGDIPFHMCVLRGPPPYRWGPWVSGMPLQCSPSVGPAHQ